MSSQPTRSTAARDALGDFAPKLVDLTDRVLFDDVWDRPDLGPRDRSLVTVSALVALGKTDQLRFHIPKALANGVDRAEVVELITHLAFYAGWPSAMSAIAVARELLGEAGGAP
ncbi:MAG: carboxymuconolactone decarboxylase family protein [Myxococcales bacterium]|nr:carboxymuconolactone decarboxylase family protein [Myxococcales bacterium]